MRCTAMSRLGVAFTCACQPSKMRYAASTPPVQTMHLRGDTAPLCLALEVCRSKMDPAIDARDTCFFGRGVDVVERSRSESVSVVRVIHECDVIAEQILERCCRSRRLPRVSRRVFGERRGRQDRRPARIADAVEV